MIPKCGHGKLTRGLGVQVTRTVRAGEFLFIYFFLQRHERVDQGLGARRTTGYMHIHGNITIDAFEHVVALLERAARNRARAHRDHIFRLRHLVVKADNLRRHFLGHGARHNHQIRLAGRRSEHFRAEAGEVEARRPCPLPITYRRRCTSRVANAELLRLYRRR